MNWLWTWLRAAAASWRWRALESPRLAEALRAASATCSACWLVACWRWVSWSVIWLTAVLMKVPGP